MKRILFISFIIALTGSAVGQQSVRHVYLVAKMNGTHSMEDGTDTDFWGFGYWTSGGQNRVFMPGPTLRFVQGDSVYIHLLNESPEDHTIHLHGLDVSQANDGVPTTSLAINPFSWGVYAWEADYSGTFLYHCHVMTTLHSAMGMYGMVVVEQDTITNEVYPNGPSYDRVYEFLCSDHKHGWNVLSPGPLNLYTPNYWMINGFAGTQMFQFPSQVINANVGDSVALRFGNVGYDKVLLRFPGGVNPTIHMSDGRPIPNVLPGDTLEIFPGERYTVFLAPTSYVEDYVEVEYQSIYGDTLSHVNHIGINTMNPPQSIPEATTDLTTPPYPNPTNGIINVEITDDTRQIQIIDVNGRIVRELPANRGLNTYQITGIENGVYFIRSNTRFLGKVIFDQE